MNLYYLNLILIFVFRTFLLQFFQFALLTVVKLEVPVTLDSSSRVGKRVLKAEPLVPFSLSLLTAGAAFAAPLPEALSAQHSSSATAPSVLLAHLGCVRHPAGSAELHFMELLFLEEKSMSESVFIILTTRSVFIHL